MCALFDSWKEKRNIKKIQISCFHEYHKTAKYDIHVGDYPFTILRDRYDVYCPKCDHEVEKLSTVAYGILMEKQKIKKEFFDGGGDCI